MLPTFMGVFEFFFEDFQSLSGDPLLDVLCYILVVGMAMAILFSAKQTIQNECDEACEGEEQKSEEHAVEGRSEQLEEEGKKTEYDIKTEEGNCQKCRGKKYRKGIEGNRAHRCTEGIREGLTVFHDPLPPFPCLRHRSPEESRRRYHALRRPVRSFLF